ncbi:hypothetical protein H0H92_014333 [Tricholoma furcatifolium]|nr:hypothetical protein H0H92_014333 [Tricholoma furcatifolium]
MSSALPTHDSDSEDEDYIPPTLLLVNPLTPNPTQSVLELRHPGNLNWMKQRRRSQFDRNSRARDALWASFQASVSSTPPTQQIPVKEMIKIEKRYQFAGETVVEVVEVPADSPDAKKWPLLHDDQSVQNRSAPTLDASSLESSFATPSTPSIVAKPPLKRPGPRKSKTTLAAIPSSSQKAKKLSTLDKSAMDWQAHVQASAESGLKDELEANRRGGGYLDKVEFLNRVGERKDEVLEASKSGKRRRH